jgi:trimeric autotransporter adhesin
MKNTLIFAAFIFLLSALMIGLQVRAQAPRAFKYQAVARDAAGNLLASQAVAFRIKIHMGSSSDTVVYTETHSVTTNTFGMVNLSIGSGTVISGTFSTIDWGASGYYVETEMDPAGGAAYVVMGTSQLLSVPYALYSEKSGTSSGSGWLLTGNSGTNPASNFLGTTDNNPLLFRVNNETSGKIDPFSYNTSLGYKSLPSSTPGNSNVAVGAFSLFQNTNRGNLVAIGDSALYNNGLLATESYQAIANTAVGSKTLFL